MVSGVMYLGWTCHSSFLFKKQGTDQPDDGRAIGEDAESVGDAVDVS
ncbi:MAG: hypothetical protein K0S21_928 [Rhizobiaceae bacterium]|jgi:hypothetical protein|nr:hypothetical protein [Rhizobiaceae bacterium]